MAFSYYRSITIDHTKCGSTDSSAFPVLVSLSDTTLKSAGNGGHVQNSNGYDVWFYSDSGLTTRIPAEREYYNATTGVFIAWVKRDVSHTVDTVFYMAYGDSGISTDPNSNGTYGATSVWDSNYKAVFHLGDGATISGSDSTSNSNNATVTLGNTLSASTGKIGGGLTGVSGTTGSIVTASIAGSSNFTVSGWIKASVVNSNLFLALVNKQTSSSSRNFWLGTTGGFYGTGGDGIVLYSHNGNQDTGNVYTSSILTDSTWHYLIATYDGTTLKIYLDNAAAVTQTVGAPDTPSSVIRIAGDSDNNYLIGSADEVRYSNAARSSDWRLTEYNNQNSPGNIGSASFYTVGSETSAATNKLFLPSTLSGLGSGGPFFQNPLG